MRRAWLVVPALAACVGIPDPPVFDRRPLVEHAIEGDRVIVRGPGYEVAFAPSGLVRMPDSIRVNGEGNLLGRNDCPLETFVGIALYPTMIASAAQAPVSSTIDPIMNGPAIVKMAVAYDVTSVCAGTPRHLTGRTSFTFFPTGRINREDSMVVPTSTEIPAGVICEQCGSAPQPVDDFYFTTFYTFAQPTFVNAAGGTAPTEPAPNQGCAVVGGRPVGVSWRMDNPGVGPRIQNNAYIHDWVRRQRTDFAPQTRAAFSDLALPVQPAPGCGAVLAATREVPIRIDGEPVPPGRDGIYRDPGEHDGELELANPGADGPMTHGFAISVDLGEPDHLRMIRGGETSDAFRMQPDPDDSDRTILWIEDGLEAGEVITFEVP